MLKQIISAGGNNLNKIIKHSEKLLALTSLMRQVLASELGEHCWIAKYSSGNLILAVDNASWATQVRYQESEIVENLKKATKFKSIKTVKSFVQKHATIEQQKPIRDTDSLKSASLLYKTALAAAKNLP
jgi:hypothetical protein